MLGDFVRDTRYGLRSFRLNPALTPVAVLSLALGIGGVAAVFGVMDAVVLKPLPVANPERLVSATVVLPQGVFDNFSGAQFEEFREARAFSSLCAWSPDRVEIRWDGQSESVPGLYVSRDYFQTLGIAPVIGSFQADGIAISYSFWKSRFHGSPGVAGQRVEIHGRPFTIAAVTPRGFFGTEIGSLPAVFIPMAFPRSDAPRLKLVGRLSHGVSMSQANAQLNAILERGLMDIVKAAPAGTPAQMKREFLQQRIELVGAGAFSPVRRTFAEPLTILMALMGFVLLIACCNIANLLLSRAVARRKEMAIRIASGANRSRLIRQLLVESLLLSATGGVAGAALAQWLRRLLVALFDTGRTAVHLDNSLDLRFLAFTAAVVTLTGLLCGVAPALRSVRIHQEMRSFSASNALLAAQVALSMCLLMGAGLFVRTLINLQRVDTGFDRRGVALMRVGPVRDYAKLLDAVRGIPGVQSASLSRFTPMEGSDFSDPIQIEGENLRVRVNFVDPQFFATLGTPLLMGRDFDAGDAARNVAIVNQSLVQHFFASGNPVGGHFRLAGPNGAAYEIVGVARDMKYRDMREAAPMTVFYSALSNPSRLGTPQLSVRIAAGRGTTTETIRRMVSSLGVPTGETTSLDEQIDDSLVQERAMAHLGGALGLLALVLTCVGLYGVVSYATSRRTREIGIRVALGAAPSVVVWPIIRQTLMIAAAGILAGLPAALQVTRWIRAGLFGVTPQDPRTLLASAALLLLVAAAAGYLPARRASLVNPAITLRSE